MKFKLKNKKELIIFVLLGIFLMLNPVMGYKVDVDTTPKTPVHQYITKESQYIWPLIPQEIKKSIEKNDK